MSAAATMSCMPASAVSRPTVARVTSRNPMRVRPQYRMRVVSMAAPQEAVCSLSKQPVVEHNTLRNTGSRGYPVIGVICRSCALRSYLSDFVGMQTKESKSPIETAIDSAKETCESGSAGACATAWDEVCMCCTYRLAFLNTAVITALGVDARWRSCLPVQLTRSRPRVPKTLWTNTVMTTQRQTSAGAYVYNMHHCCSAETVMHFSWPVDNMLACHGLCPMLSLLSHVAVTCRVYED